jgi:predicted Zn-dependent protease with MMP-like domain
MERDPGGAESLNGARPQPATSPQCRSCGDASGGRAGIVCSVDDDSHIDPETQRLLDDAWDALDDGDLKAAARGLATVLVAAPDAPAVFELEAGLALAREVPDAALDAYHRWNDAVPDDPEPWMGSAEVYLDYGDPGEAARILRELLAEFELDPLDEADARHLLGLACDEKGDRKGTAKEWLAVLRLDAANEDPKPLMSAKRFEKVAAAALDELPEEILVRLQNVPIFVEDRPSEALVLEGLDPRTLGLFHGIAMPDQSVLGGSTETGLIHLFQRNLEREAEDEADLAEQIRITVLHETAHYFGADEGDLQRFGLN